MNSDKKTCYVVLINGHETITNGVYLNKKILEKILKLENYLNLSELTIENFKLI